VLDVVTANLRPNTGESSDIDATITRIPKKRDRPPKHETQPSMLAF